MKLWLVSQYKNDDYDTYDSFVCAAGTEIEAKMIHPGIWPDEWDGKIDEKIWADWTSVENVKAKLLGTAIKGTKKSIICSSYNAG